MKRSIWILLLVGAAVTLAQSAHSDGNQYSTEPKLNPTDYDIAGAWVSSSPAIPGVYSVPFLGTQTITPSDLSGKRFNLIGDAGNGDPTFVGLFPDVDRIPAGVGTYVRTGPRSYRFTFLSYFVKSPPPGSFDRGEVRYFWVNSGTVEFVNSNTRIDKGILSFYSNADLPNVVFPPFGINGLHDQDQDDDGFADAGEVPFLCLPFEIICKRVPMTEPCTPSSP